MTEKFSAPEQEIVNLLSKLEAVDIPYPPDLMNQRRITYMEQIKSLLERPPSNGGGEGSNSTTTNATSAANTASTSGASLASGTSLIATALAAVLVVEIVAAGFLLRNEISQLVNSIFSSPTTSVVLPVDPIITDNAATLPIEIATETPVSETPSPVVTIPPRVSTSEPDALPDARNKTNQGNHYGQTDQPSKSEKPEKPDNPPKKKP